MWMACRYFANGKELAGDELASYMKSIPHDHKVKALPEIANRVSRISWTPGEAQPSNPKNMGQTGEAADKADKGLRHWYNERVPMAFEKLTGQKMKVGKTDHLTLSNKIGADPIEQKVNYIDLPQSVKDTALHKGFPLFSSGLMLNPVSGDPFKKSKYKLVPVKEAPKFE